MRRLTAILTLAALTGCATPSEPVVIPQNRVPFQIARGDLPEPQTGARRQDLSIALVRRARLVTVERSISTREPAATIAIRTLLDGPTASERERGLSSAIPTSTRLLSIEVIDRVAEVNLSQEFQEAASGQGFLLRVAQVVGTLVALEDIVAVRFSIDGQVVAVPTDRGEPVTRPVTSADYAQERPRNP